MSVTRPIEIDDAEALAAHRANRDFFFPWLLERPAEMMTSDGFRDWIEKLLDDHRSGLGVTHVILDDDRVVGEVGVRDVVREAAQLGTLGYWVAPESNGRGLSTAAAAEMCELAFAELGLHRLEAATQVPNVGSQRVLERNGFDRIGLAPGYLWIGGDWQDHIVWQRLTNRA